MVKHVGDVGERRLPAVVIWFGDHRAIRYVWDTDCGDIRRQTWADGTVLDEETVGNCRAEMIGYALEFLAEYVAVYSDDEEALARDRPDVHELLVAAGEGE